MDHKTTDPAGQLLPHGLHSASICTFDCLPLYSSKKKVTHGSLIESASFMQLNSNPKHNHMIFVQKELKLKQWHSIHKWERQPTKAPQQASNFGRH